MVFVYTEYRRIMEYHELLCYRVFSILFTSIMTLSGGATEYFVYDRNNCRYVCSLLRWCVVVRRESQSMSQCLQILTAVVGPTGFSHQYHCCA